MMSAKKPQTSPVKTYRQLYGVRGMTCRSCELLIEQKLAEVAGVTDVRASERRGEVEIFSTKRIGLSTLRSVLTDSPYTLQTLAPIAVVSPAPSAPEPTGINWIEVGGMLVLVIALFYIFRTFHVFSFSSNIEGALGFGSIFTIGLVAATSSCLALVGGLLLSVSAKWAEAHEQADRWTKFQPMLLFNVGRLGGYFLLGGLVGLAGKVLTLSPKMTGILTIIIAIVMVILGLNILRILPKRYCTLPLPKSMMRRIQALSASQNPAMPLALGALTFFVPCGFTQSMQVLALGSGSFLHGGLIMLTFALGTLPSLLSISVISTVLEGRAARTFLRFSGTVVLLLGLVNINSGLLLTGVDAEGLIERTLMPTSIQGQLIKDPYVSTDAQGHQIIVMYVTDSGYSPNTFTIHKGQETWIYAIAQKPVSGCAAYLVDASHNLEVPINVGTNWLGPIMNPQHDFVLTCSMGMLRADVLVR